MDTYLRKFGSMLPEQQSKYLNEAIRELMARGIVSSAREARAIIDSYGISSEGKPLTNAPRVELGSRVGDSGYNAVMDNFLVDLQAIYAQSTSTGQTIADHENISKMWVSNITNAMDVMDGQIEEFKKLVGNSDGYTAIHNENFSKYTEAIYNDMQLSNGNLTIKPSDSVRYNGRKLIGRVTTTPYPAENHAAGIYMAAPAEFNIEEDYSDGTNTMLTNTTSSPGYWLSVVLTDQDIKSTIDSETYHGYVCLLRIFFNSSVEINELTIDPVGKYTSYIRRIRYRKPGTYPTDIVGWTTLTYTDDDDDTALVSGSGDGNIKLYFPPTTMSSLEIMFNDPDYDIIRFQFSPNVIRDSLLWNELTNREYSYIVDMNTGINNVDEDEVTSAGNISLDNTDYLSRTIIDMDSVQTLNDTLATVRASLGIDGATDLEAIGDLDNAVLTDKVAVAGLGSYLTTINKNEYTLGAYSVTPENVLYPPSGVYHSHDNAGYDTYEGVVREVALETVQHTPGLTSIEYSVLTDAGEEFPIVPRGTVEYREALKGTIAAGGSITINTTFTPAGDVILYRWEDDAAVEVQTQTPSDSSVTFTGLDHATTYAMEYVVESTTEDPYLLDLPVLVSGVAWRHTELVPISYTIPLDNIPYIDYSKYDWDSTEWGYASGIAGYYSDSTVLIQDMDSAIWDTPDGVTNTVFASGFRDRYIFTATVAGSATGVCRFTYNGTGGEYNEYGYSWEEVIPSPGEYTVTLQDANLVPPTPTINANLYEPLELFIDGSKAEDRTGWKSETQDPLDDYTTTGDYQYYLLGDNIYTNVDFNDGIYRRVSARYRFLTAYLTLKIVMYTNSGKPSYYTPRLDSYQLKFLGES